MTDEVNTITTNSTLIGELFLAHNVRANTTRIGVYDQGYEILDADQVIELRNALNKILDADVRLVGNLDSSVVELNDGNFDMYLTSPRDYACYTMTLEELQNLRKEINNAILAKILKK